MAAGVRQYKYKFFYLSTPSTKKIDDGGGGGGGDKKEKKIILKILATNIATSRLTGTPTACAKSFAHLCNIVHDELCGGKYMKYLSEEPNKSFKQQ